MFKWIKSSLDDNDLPIPAEILIKVREPQLIFDYYSRHLAEGRHPLNEAKLSIVGESGVGKTSLIQRIRFGTFDRNQTKTEGISVNQWHTAPDSNRKKAFTNNKRGEFIALDAGSPSSIKLNIWDFGGQEIMHATHQFFSHQAQSLSAGA
jgi:internalin A